jgi:hypothetical protein
MKSHDPGVLAAVLAFAALLSIPDTASATHRSFASPPRNWTGDAFYGTYGTFFADVDGDGKADAIAVNADRIWYRSSNGCSFGPNRALTSSPFYGELGTYFADVTGDGKADAIANNKTNVIVRRSDDGTRVTFFKGPLSTNVSFADVDGDGKADAIEMEPYGIIVSLSDGKSFTGRVNWTTSFPVSYGNEGTYFADVTGDGRADAIFVNDWGIEVRQPYPPQRNFYPEAKPWASDPYYGQIMNVFVDMTGDRKADAVVVNYDGVAVRDSTGFAFRGLNDNLQVTDGDAPIRQWGYWTLEGFYGSRLTAFADVDGDRAADAIAVNDDGVWIRKSNFADYGDKCR